MEADVRGNYQAMSVAVNKRMHWPSRRKIMNKSRQRSRMRVKLYIDITTKEQENSKLECCVKEKLVCERDQQDRMAVGSTPAPVCGGEAAETSGESSGEPNLG